MKKIILAFILVLLGSPSFTYASNMDSYYNFEQGWNLITGFIRPENIVNGEVLSKNIKAVYFLKQPNQEFVRIYPDPETKKMDGIDDSYYEKTPQFVYSDKVGKSKYNLEEPLPPKYWNEHQIYKGWNLIGVSDYMIANRNSPDLTLNDLKGTCNIEKVYAFLGGQWRTLNTLGELDSILLLRGLLIKVSNNCVMGMATNGNIVPPQLPH